MVKQARKLKDHTLDVLKRVENGNMNGWDWDDFVGVRQSAKELEELREVCLRAKNDFPSGAIGWCGPQGMEQIRRKAAELAHRLSEK